MNKPDAKNRSFTRRSRIFGILPACVLFCASIAAPQIIRAQQTPPAVPTPTAKPAPPVTIYSPRPPVWKTKTSAANDQPTPAEKALKTDAKVNVSLCVTEGNLRISGWERSEIRVFVKNGSKVGYKVLEKNRKTQDPIWVEIVGFDPATDKNANFDECLVGEEIEIDMPKAAVVNLKSRESEIRIDSVAKARVENGSGAIFLDNISNGIEAVTYEGDVAVQNSSGSVSVSSTTGNIFAVDVDAAEIADSFKAKTRSGKVTLQRVSQRDLEISSATGTINFTGEFTGGGRYNFKTTNGAITLGVPEKTSCKMSATYAFGSFRTDLAMTTANKEPQRFTGVFGTGDCTLNMTTYSGAIRIKKQD